jgi:cytochrome c oxidase cbb3-type subunit 2
LDNDLNYEDIEARMRALRITGVPYSVTEAEFQANVETYGKEMANMLDVSLASQSLLAQASANDFDGLPARVTEMEALVAYLQVLGTMVDFSQYEEGYFAEFR